MNDGESPFRLQLILQADPKNEVTINGSANLSNGKEGEKLRSPLDLRPWSRQHHLRHYLHPQPGFRNCDVSKP